MATLYLLGTGAAVSDPHRTTTMLALESDGPLIVIDCGGDAIQRLMACGLDPLKLRALVITHEHADHAGGFPLFMEKIWLLGRREPVPVYGIAPALAQARRLHDCFDTSEWSGYPGITWHEVAEDEGATVLSDAAWHITSAPGQHAVPVIGLRAEARTAGRSLVYSCDTEPSDAIVRLAAGVNVLVHEATGAGPGHSSAQQAAEIAARAQVDRLLLVHLPPEHDLDDHALAEARSSFAKLEKGDEGGRYEI